MHTRKLSLLLAVLCANMLMTVTPPAEACLPICPATTGCKRTASVFKAMPLTLLVPAAPFNLNVPVGVNTNTFSANPSCSDPGTVTGGTITVTLTAVPPFAGGPFVGTAVLPPVGASGFASQTIQVPVPIPAGTLGLFAVVANVAVNFSPSSNNANPFTLNVTGDTLVCFVEPAPGNPTQPRLDLRVAGNAMVACPAGTQVDQVYIATNNDPVNSLTVTATATSEQTADIDLSSVPLTSDVAATSGLPGQDDFPIEFVSNLGASGVLPLPSDHTQDVPPITQALSIPPGQSRMVTVATTSHSACGDGSCSESTLTLSGTFSNGDLAFACVGTSVNVDNSISCGCPRPTGLTCLRSCAVGTVDLAWVSSAMYDAIEVYRDGALVASLSGAATSFVDSPSTAAHFYQVVAICGDEIRSITCSVPPCSGGSANDCVNAIPAALGLNSLDTTTATTDGLGVDPSVCNQWTAGADDILHNDVWFTYTVAADGIFTVSTCDIGGFDSKIAVWDAAVSCPPDPLVDVPLGCQDDQAGCTGFTSQVELVASVGDQLLIQIGGFDAASTGAGLFELSEGGVTPVQAPAVNCSLFGTDLTVDWTPAAMGPAATGFEVTRNGVAVVGSPFGPGAGMATIDVSGLFGTQTIVVSATDSVTMTTASASCSVDLGTPANDDCTGAIAVGLGTTAIANDGATADGTTACGTLVNVWFTFTPATSGLFTLDTCGSNWETELAVFEDGLVCPPVVELGCSSQGVGTTSCTPQSSLSLMLTAGNTYLLSVDGFAGDTGNAGVLNIEEAIEPPIAPVCDDTVAGEITVTWTEPATLPMSYNIFVNGVLEGTAAVGTPSFTYMIPMGAFGLADFCVEAVDGATTSEQVCCQASLGAAPNDDCANAAPAVLGLNPIDNNVATTDGLGVDPTTCSQWTAGADDIIHSDLWFTYTVGATGLFRASTCGIANLDTKIAIWDGTVGCLPDPLVDTPLDCQDDGVGCAGFTSDSTFVAAMGQTLLIQVGGFAAASLGSGDLLLEEGLPIPLQPVENVTCDASVLDMLIVNWTDPSVGPAPDGYNVFFNGVLDAGSPFPAGTTSFTQDVTGFVGVAELCVEAVLSTTAEAAGQACCSVSFSTPANDLCANAEVVALGVPATLGTTLAALNDGTSTCGTAAANGDVWYSFTAPNDGTFLFSSCGTHDGPGVDLGTDTVINTFDMCGGVELLCDDDAGPPPCPGNDTGLLRDSVVAQPMLTGETVLIRVSQFGTSAPGDFTLNVSQDCGSIDPITCDYDCATDSLTITWTDNALATVGYDILENGAVVASVPAGSNMAVVMSPTAGTNTYDVTWACALGGVGAPATCTVDIPAALTLSAGTTDVIFHLEGLDDAGALGDIDSGAALELALTNNARTVSRLAVQDFDVLINEGCLDLAGVEIVWVMTGTFDNDTRLSVGEGDALAALGASGVGIYFEGADHWGFQHVDSLLDARDGIEEVIAGNIADGDDSFTEMDGTNAAIAGLDLSSFVDVTYNQDQLALSDFTDTLSITGTTMGAIGDPDVISAEVIWNNSDDMLPGGVPEDGYITGVIAIHSDTGTMISQSWEFGGFGGDQNTLAAIYLDALGRPSGGNDFDRGDCNQDGTFNIADAVFLLGSLFPPPGGMPSVLDCLNACDGNDDGSLNIADAVSALAALFPPPGSPPAGLPAPFGACGADPTPSLDCLTPVCP